MRGYMEKRILSAVLTMALTVVPFAFHQVNAGPDAAAVALEDMSGGGSFVPGREYRLSITGIIGTVEATHVLVTRVKPGSPVEGKVLPGDHLIRIQGGVLEQDPPATIHKHMQRLWRDSDGRLALTFSRPGANGQAASVFSLKLRLPAPPGTIQHWGPIGIHAAMQEAYIEITEVLTGSPADGRLSPGDRIVKVAGKPVQGNLYTLFSESIVLAETEARGGVLELRVWRPATTNALGGEFDVTLALPVIGTRSASSPVDCPVTDVLIKRAADAIMKSGDAGQLGIGLLGLLATGEERYIAYVGERLHEAAFAKPDIQLPRPVSWVSWAWSYQLMTLCEYYILTGDAYVLPAIRTYAQTIARGQDVAGLWNHRMADPEANGGRQHGRLYGYGAINQTSIALWIGLILAEKCGVNDPEIQTAIEKTHALYANWAGRGALPYGNHAAMENMLNNNGTSGSVAVGFALRGDKDAARFYAGLSAASHGEITAGHTGPFFNYLWSGLGANVLGPEVWAAFEREVRWLRTMTRLWDGRFQYMEPRGNVFNYSDLSSTGANLLNMAAGRRALHITGKGMDSSLWLKGDQAAAAVDRPYPDTEMSVDTLLLLLGHRLPPVRLEAAERLAEHQKELGHALQELLLTGTRDQRIGALHALRHSPVPGAADLLMPIIRDASEELWIREVAIGTLATLDTAKPFAAELLGMIASDQTKDPFRSLQLALGQALEKILPPSSHAHDVDRDVLYKAVLRLLEHPHMWARGAGMTLLANMPIEDLHRVAKSVLHVIRDEDPAYTAYQGDGPRQAGLDLLNRLNIEDVLALTIKTINEPTGRGGVRKLNRMRLIQSFGREAEPLIPLIQEALGKEADPLVEAIRSAPSTRQMIPLAEFMPPSGQKAEKGE